MKICDNPASTSVDIADNNPLEKSMPEFMARQISLSQSEESWLEQRHKVRVRVGNWPPYSYWDHGPCGIAVDYMMLLAAKFSLNVEFLQASLPWSEALKNLLVLRDPIFCWQ